MTVDVALLVARRDHESPEDGEAHLPSVGVTCEEQTDTRGGEREHVGGVAEGQDGGVRGGLLVGFLHEATAGGHVRYAQYPDLLAPQVEQGALALQHLDPAGLEGGPSALPVVPPVVVPQHGEGPCVGLPRAQRLGRLLGWDRRGPPVLGHVISQ